MNLNLHSEAREFTVKVTSGNDMEFKGRRERTGEVAWGHVVKALGTGVALMKEIPITAPSNGRAQLSLVFYASARGIFVAHGPEDFQWRSPAGRQRDFCGRRSGFAIASARQLFVGSERDWFPY
ncbi:hypothetical protein P7K49_024871 [Saguinus oedipus]|uniref:Uncharacterized protein n=1 Tax=Saguinus oedipus TaxID=9490 RepID=A0ABQ9UFI5_SAGOE|nr:hypothetical protein P7K49_024871 [Saguinus oedipus]